VYKSCTIGRGLYDDPYDDLYDYGHEECEYDAYEYDQPSLAEESGLGMVLGADDC